MNNYDDIINLEHPISKNHSRMSLNARSAQFAPFSALTGYAEAINEASRLTDERIELDECLKSILDNKLQLLQKCNEPKVTFTYFVSDQKKSGGKYVSTTGVLKKIDLYNNVVIMNDNTKIPIKEIIDIKKSNENRY